jgi:mRNA interferase MazF
MPESENAKDFIEWNNKKFRIESRKDIPHFKEGEIWDCSIGSNIGSEQDGKGKNSSRPIVIVRKYNKDLFTAFPLTTKGNASKHYFDLFPIQGLKSKAILSQARSLSSKRLRRKIGVLQIEVFIEMKKAASEYIFGS